jgi:RNA recognition motif-containing protein
MNNNNKKLYASNLPKNYDEEDLHSKISQLFSKFGDLEQVALFRQTRGPLAGHLSGTAIIEFKKANDAQEAINYLNDKQILGSKISLKFYRNREGYYSSFNDISSINSSSMSPTKVAQAEPPSLKLCQTSGCRYIVQSSKSEFCNSCLKKIDENLSAYDRPAMMSANSRLYNVPKLVDNNTRSLKSSLSNWVIYLFAFYFEIFH